MEKLWMCRICLAEDTQMHLVSDIHLKNVYESLTSRPFETEDNRPIVMCYICHAQLQNCHQLKMRCLCSEELFTKMLVSKTLNSRDRPISKQLDILHPVIHLSINGKSQENVITIDGELPELAIDVKIEHENVEETENLPQEENRVSDITEDDGLDKDIIVEENDLGADLNLEENNLAIHISPKHNTMRTELHLEDDGLSTGLTTTGIVTDSNLLDNGLPTVTLTDSNRVDNGLRIDLTTNDLSNGRTTELTSNEQSLEKYLEEDDLLTKLSSENNIVTSKFNENIENNNTEIGLEESSKTDTNIVEKSIMADLTVEVNDLRPDLTLEVNDLNTNVISSKTKDKISQIVSEDDGLTTDLSREDNVLRTDVAPHSNIDFRPKILKVMLERISLDNLKKTSPVPENSRLTRKQKDKYIKNNKRKNKTMVKKCKSSSNTDIKACIKTIIKNASDKHIIQKITFDDIDKENIIKIAKKQTNKKKKNKPFVCDLCKKCFTIKDTLRIHIRAHTQEKRYQCDVCDKKYNHQNAFLLHYRTHTGVKPYQCGVCQKGFHRKDCLERHILIHTALRPFTCDYCGRTFKILSSWTQHVRTHIGDKPHKCDVCDKRFLQKRSLVMHERIHTDEKPFKCDVCKRYFSSREKLLDHFKIHSQKEPYNCDVCKRNFICNKNYLKHLKKHNGIRSKKT